MLAQSGQFVPCSGAIGRTKKGGVLNPCVDRVRIGEGRLQVPDALELPWMRRAVVPLVGSGNARVSEFVAHGLPGLASIVRALDQLSEPAGGLRRVQPVRIGGGSLQVIDLPACKMRTADVPTLTRGVRRQYERP